MILGWRLIPTHSYVFPSKYLTVCIPAQIPAKVPNEFDNWMKQKSKIFVQKLVNKNNEQE